MNVGYHPAPTDLLTYHRPAAMLLGRSMHRMRVIGLVTYHLSPMVIRLVNKVHPAGGHRLGDLRSPRQWYMLCSD